MRVLVTGGAGYIGSVVTEELLQAGHSVVVYDNLVKGHRAAVASAAEFVQGDLNDSRLLRQTLAQVEAVIHLAAASLVGESVRQPDKYFEQNVGNGLILLQAMKEQGVQRLVFSSTAAVYGEPEKQPIEESDPLKPTNPYGAAKLCFENALPWYEQAFGLRYVSLRYFNAAGATEQCGEDHEPETHLIPLVLQAAAGQRDYVEIYGDDYPTPDGTCIRDYVHVSDLARVHVLALAAERSAVYNLGCGGRGYSVRAVIAAAQAVTGREIPVRYAARRPGDPAVLIAASDKIKRELGWQPQQQDLHTIIESAWRWRQQHPQGYRA